MIKRIILIVYQLIKRIIENIGHWYNTQSLIYKNEETIQCPELAKGKYLILIPHSDDEWIGNSTLIVNNKYKVELFDMDMPGGDTISVHQERFAEMKKLANRFGRRLHSIKEGDDLYEVIESFHPEYVTLPFFYDWHPEHRKVMEIMHNLEDVRGRFKVVMYQVSVPIASYNITHVNPLGRKEHFLKWKLFKRIYHTQFFFPSYRASCQERVNGKMAGLYACEVYCVMNFQDWKANYAKMIPNEKEIALIKKNLVSVKRVRECNQNNLSFVANKE